MTRRVILIGLALVVAIIVAAAAVAYWLFSGDGIRRALESQASYWLGQPVRIASANGQLFPRLGIKLRDVRIGEPLKMRLADVDVSTSLRSLLSRRIEEADVLISDSRIELPVPIGSADSGPDASETSASSSAGPPIEIVSVRTIALRDVVLASRGREIALTADAALNGSELRLARFVASSGQTNLNASGTITLGSPPDARLDVSANRLDVDELLVLASAFLPDKGVSSGASSGGGSARVSARITAEGARAASVDVNTFSTDLLLDNERITLEPLRFNLFGGTYDGALRATVGDVLDVRLTSTVAKIDVAQLAAFGGVPDTITGLLTGNATVAGRGADLAAVLRSARGTGSASIVDGTIKRLNLVRTIVLFFGRPEPDAEAGRDGVERSAGVRRQGIPAADGEP